MVQYIMNGNTNPNIDALGQLLAVGVLQCVCVLNCYVSKPFSYCFTFYSGLYRNNILCICVNIKKLM